MSLSRKRIVIGIFFKFASFFSMQSLSVCPARITAICAVNDTMWVGTEEGQVFIYDAVSRMLIEDRHLAVLPGQGIMSISHLQANYQVKRGRRLQLVHVAIFRPGSLITRWSEGGALHLVAIFRPGSLITRWSEGGPCI